MHGRLVSLSVVVIGIFATNIKLTTVWPDNNVRNGSERFLTDRFLCIFAVMKRVIIDVDSAFIALFLFVWEEHLS